MAIKELGSGIAQAGPDKHEPGTARVVYGIGEEFLPMLRTLGRALSINEQVAMKDLEPGTLAIDPFGQVWQQNEDGKPVVVVSANELEYAYKIAERESSQTTLNEVVDPSNGKQILVQTIQSGDRRAYQVWLPRSPEDTNVLVDAVYCSHFGQPAAHADGSEMTSAEIYEVAQKVGITFVLDAQGKPLLNPLF